MAASKDWTPERDLEPTLRDRLAAQEHFFPNWPPALIEEYLGIPAGTYRIDKHLPAFVAKWRYAMADAMLKEGGYEI